VHKFGYNQTLRPERSARVFVRGNGIEKKMVNTCHQTKEFWEAIAEGFGLMSEIFPS
jgi:hypothetical protein